MGCLTRNARRYEFGRNNRNKETVGYQPTIQYFVRHTAMVLLYFQTSSRHRSATMNGIFVMLLLSKVLLTVLHQGTSRRSRRSATITRISGIDLPLLSLILLMTIPVFLSNQMTIHGSGYCQAILLLYLCSCQIRLSAESNYHISTALCWSKQM